MHYPSFFGLTRTLVVGSSDVALLDGSAFHAALTRSRLRRFGQFSGTVGAGDLGGRTDDVCETVGCSCGGRRIRLEVLDVALLDGSA